MNRLGLFTYLNGLFVLACGLFALIVQERLVGVWIIAVGVMIVASRSAFDT